MEEENQNTSRITRITSSPTYIYYSTTSEQLTCGERRSALRSAVISVSMDTGGNSTSSSNTTWTTAVSTNSSSVNFSTAILENLCTEIGEGKEDLPDEDF